MGRPGRRRPESSPMGLSAYFVIANAAGQSGTEAESLVKAGKFDKAEDLILNTNRALMKASGTCDALRQEFRAANDDSIGS